MLKELLKKVNKQSDQVEPSQTLQAVYKEKIREILADHKIDAEKHKELVEELLLWKKQI